MSILFCTILKVRNIYSRLLMFLYSKKQYLSYIGDSYVEFLFIYMFIVGVTLSVVVCLFVDCII
ncbi:hypothetical protein EHRUM1_08890 [Ehrlichia ruminantium]|uniref:Uncharacterized protein n=1 Tax=Ehrlichia ruminantium (strain Welgevonden) TaxID=254945 RepID=A0A0H3M0C6_EHRRW|nr:hypothetical protein EHRUM1_08890 [Ehrlichia ruminantium]CAI27380.1 Hypothetical protein ERWE_CDS_08860 [Ehrlichia ruminantium str. Welgevonden]